MSSRSTGSDGAVNDRQRFDHAAAIIQGSGLPLNDFDPCRTGLDGDRL